MGTLRQPLDQSDDDQARSLHGKAFKRHRVMETWLAVTADFYASWPRCRSGLSTLFSCSHGKVGDNLVEILLKNFVLISLVVLNVEGELPRILCC